MALKLKLSENVSTTFSTGMDLRGIAEAKTKSLPVGFAFDLKL